MVPRPNIRWIPELVVCRSLMFMWSFGPPDMGVSEKLGSRGVLIFEGSCFFGSKLGSPHFWELPYPM